MKRKPRRFNNALLSSGAGSPACAFLCAAAGSPALFYAPLGFAMA
ncbi:hypothetical protein LTSEBAI_3473 [Salmonella enterica subsp. enterica serovar Baildon str. R6-199]|nr:hypothetical protein LTSEBAI_3473 [Salmonella enterica subsp. enterica serovar Baildon str. R6-199]